MLGVLCVRPPKPWILSPQTFSLHYRHYQNPVTFDGHTDGGEWRRDYLRPPHFQNHHEHNKGEGSWNVAWDARPARWLHRVDFPGVFRCLEPIGGSNDVVVCAETGAVREERECKADGGDAREDVDSEFPNYRVTGVQADGRCLFRAIAHVACLQSGEEAPDENRQRELADELRARVVDELLKRREEIEWIIEGDFDTYVKSIQQPHNWAGEPELLMAAHYLKTPISVFMKDSRTGNLTNIANYGEEYQKEKELPINVLFHGYGHYDILETPFNQICDEIVW